MNYFNKQSQLDALPKYLPLEINKIIISYTPLYRPIRKLRVPKNRPFYNVTYLLREEFKNDLKCLFIKEKTIK